MVRLLCPHPACQHHELAFAALLDERVVQFSPAQSGASVFLSLRCPACRHGLYPCPGCLALLPAQDVECAACGFASTAALQIANQTRTYDIQLHLNSAEYLARVHRSYLTSACHLRSHLHKTHLDTKPGVGAGTPRLRRCRRGARGGQRKSQRAVPAQPSDAETPQRRDGDSMDVDDPDRMRCDDLGESISEPGPSALGRIGAQSQSEGPLSGTGNRLQTPISVKLKMSGQRMKRPGPPSQRHLPGDDSGSPEIGRASAMRYPLNASVIRSRQSNPLAAKTPTPNAQKIPPRRHPVVLFQLHKSRMDYVSDPGNVILARNSLCGLRPQERFEAWQLRHDDDALVDGQFYSMATASNTTTIATILEFAAALVETIPEMVASKQLLAAERGVLGSDGMESRWFRQAADYRVSDPRSNYPDASMSMARPPTVGRNCVQSQALASFLLRRHHNHIDRFRSRCLPFLRQLSLIRSRIEHLRGAGAVGMAQLPDESQGPLDSPAATAGRELALLHLAAALADRLADNLPHGPACASMNPLRSQDSVARRGRASRGCGVVAALGHPLLAVRSAWFVVSTFMVRGRPKRMSLLAPERMWFRLGFPWLFAGPSPPPALVGQPSHLASMDAMHIYRIPSEVLVEIARYLTPAQLRELARSCRHIRRALDNGPLLLEKSQFGQLDALASLEPLLFQRLPTPPSELLTLSLENRMSWLAISILKAADNELFNANEAFEIVNRTQNTSPPLVRLLIHKGAPLYRHGGRCLVNAASQGAFETIATLVDEGFRPNGLHGGEALVKALEAGHRDVALYLLPLCDLVHYVGQAAVQVALRTRDFDMFHLLISEGRYNLQRDNGGLLLNAVADCDLESVRWLILMGYPVAEVGILALSEALVSKQDELFQELLVSFESPVDDLRFEALLRTATRDGLVEIVKYLNDRGYYLNILTGAYIQIPDAPIVVGTGFDPRKDGRYCLRTAAEKRDIHTIEVLVRLGVDVRGRDGAEAMIDAIVKGYEDIVIYFLTAGVSLLRYGAEAITFAKKYGRTGIIELLVANMPDHAVPPPSFASANAEDEHADESEREPDSTLTTTAGPNPPETTTEAVALEGQDEASLNRRHMVRLAQASNIRALDQLRRDGASFNTMYAHDALITAVAQKRVQVVLFLIKKCSMSLDGYVGRQAVKAAIRNRDLFMLDLLTLNSPNPFNLGTDDGSLLVSAVEESDEDMIRRLISRESQKRKHYRDPGGGSQASSGSPGQRFGFCGPRCWPNGLFK
ncbi:uncharacterized protein BJ171DRAFT_567176 [Polychytrium aggregatum]|uniref:uncharacterized protein n=1 Tax=Polychytrium aggregatum TaxID=110093 RepID=UPI0022FE0956|nr:uncharacterized protein BJ171DRAFT_567176 [Polychytrium aggregatum]KAI9205871.1 hypothetical protein BJ171DRAFT_567176 [Polychytrium aggregatum]